MTKPIKRYTISGTGNMDGEYFKVPDVIALVESLKKEFIYSSVLGPLTKEAEGAIAVIETVLTLLEKKTPGKSLLVPRCPKCGLDITPDTCFCGRARDNHKVRHPFRPKGCVCRVGESPNLRESLDAVLNYKFEDDIGTTAERLGSREFVYSIFELPFSKRFHLFKDFRLIEIDEYRLKDETMITLALKRVKERNAVEQRDFIQRVYQIENRIKGGT